MSFTVVGTSWRFLVRLSHEPSVTSRVGNEKHPLLGTGQPTPLHNFKLYYNRLFQLDSPPLLNPARMVRGIGWRRATLESTSGSREVNLSVCCSGGLRGTSNWKRCTAKGPSSKPPAAPPAGWWRRLSTASTDFMANGGFPVPSGAHPFGTGAQAAQAGK